MEILSNKSVVKKLRRTKINKSVVNKLRQAKINKSVVSKLRQAKIKCRIKLQQFNFVKFNFEKHLC